MFLFVLRLTETKKNEMRSEKPSVRFPYFSKIYVTRKETLYLIGYFPVYEFAAVRSRRQRPVASDGDQKERSRLRAAKRPLGFTAF